MSYDLYFKPREQTAAPDVDALTGYLRQRGKYEISEQQAIYQNDATGVYFIFDLGNPEVEEQPGLAPVSLNLNYFRPHIFGLESELEVKALVENFGLEVSDPQVEGMGDGQYTTEGFLSGWNKGNEFGYRSILAQHPDETLLTLPTAQIERCWRWNFARDGLQVQLGEDIFVPRIMFLELQRQVMTAVVWPDAIPTAIPEADMLLIPRKTILPKKFFRHPEDLAMVAWADVKPVLEQFPVKQFPVPYYFLDYATPPDAIVSYLRSLQPTTEKPEAVPTDKILNAELVAAARVK